jgi:hypothetical protein
VNFCSWRICYLILSHLVTLRALQGSHFGPLHLVCERGRSDYIAVSPCFQDCLKNISNLNKLAEWHRANALELNLVNVNRSLLTCFWVFLHVGRGRSWSCWVIMDNRMSFAQDVDITIGKSLTLCVDALLWRTWIECFQRKFVRYALRELGWT